MSDWDDLFAAASGQIDDPQQAVVFEEVKERKESKTSSPPRKKKRRRKDKKRDASASDGITTGTSREKMSSLYQQFLESRMDQIDHQISDFPHWIKLGPSLCKTQGSPFFCTWYKTDGKTCISNCTRCNLSPLYHSCHNEEDIDFLRNITLIRDMRCCCSCIFEITSSQDKWNNNHGQDNTKVKSSCLEFAKTMKRNSKSLFSSSFELSLGERDILENKFRNVKQNTEKLCSLMQKWHQHSNGKGKVLDSVDNSKHTLSGIFDLLVQVMISLDTAYYRLYYLQVAGYFPIFGSEKDGLVHIPHPTTYFGVDGFSWNVSKGQDWISKFPNKVVKSIFRKNCESSKMDAKEEKVKAILDAFTSSATASREEKEVDPLSFLYSNRYAESLLIFWSSNWINSKDTHKQIKRACEQLSSQGFYEKHETVSPSILSQWRNCCRDLLCNLYGYATLHPSTIQEIKEELDSQNSSYQIVEVGAGTGYLAYLFREHGIDINPYDIAPTLSPATNEKRDHPINEYHGSTPQFVHVKHGDDNHLEALLKQTRDYVHSTTLLLCYPPPQTNMAESMLNVFKSAGGECIIHVGEFSGLTGTVKFQKKLVEHFNLKRRFNCLNWGTDAAEVTIWMKKDARSQEKSILLPCSNCHDKESRKQCRYLRTLRYCSEECFTQHLIERSAYFALNHIPLFASMESQDFISYSDRNHFNNL